MTTLDARVMARASEQADALARFAETFRTRAGVTRYRDNILEATVNLVTGEVVVRLEDDARTIVLRADPLGRVVEFHPGNWVKYLNDVYFSKGKEIRIGQGRNAAIVARQRAKAFTPVDDADLFQTPPAKGEK